MKRSCLLFALAAATHLAAAPSALGAPPAAPPPVAAAAGPSGAPDEVTLDQVVALVRRRSPRLAAQRAEIDIAAAEVVGADLYPNPAISYGVTRTLDGEDTVNGTTHEVTVQQPIPVAGQLGARRSAAEHALAAARARAAASEVDAVRDARALFVALLAAQARAGVLEAARADLDRVGQVVEGRAQGGMMSRYDTLRIEVERASVAAQLDAARAEVEDASGRLAVHLGIPGWRPRAVGALDASPAPPPVAVAALPSVRAARGDEAAALAAIDVAERERWPIPNVGVGALWTTRGYSFSGSLGVSLDLPLFDRGQGAIARAKAAARAAAAAREAVENETARDAERARALLALRRRTLQAFQRDVVARLPALREMAEDAYTSGRGSILDLLDTLRTHIEARLVEIEHQQSAMLAAVDVLALSEPGAARR
ncbi:TolC family protein [Sorangium sp. So ce513]|uniref:TolC family protein n=1 Tax=Sorangium sp. So ce513 TaxID=3133315 RepID=UPI003F60D990